jgi:transposase
MGNSTDALDGFLKEYGESGFKSFCDGIEKDIAPVKNAISLPVSSGLVEGCNNKFKLIKRSLYGRSGFVNLRQKCMLAFAMKDPKFNLRAMTSG